MNSALLRLSPSGIIEKHPADGWHHTQDDTCVLPLLQACLCHILQLTSCDA